MQARTYSEALKKLSENKAKQTLYTLMAEYYAYMRLRLLEQSNITWLADCVKNGFIQKIKIQDMVASWQS